MSRIHMLHHPLPRPLARIRKTNLRTWMATAAAAIAITACDNMLIPLPQEGPPEAMDFAMSGFGVSTRYVQLRGDTVVLRRTDWADSQISDSVHVVPTAQDWRDFWSAAEQAGVRRWARRYVDEDVVDGSGWGLRIVNEGWVLESDGSNAYPDRNGREHREITPDFQRFVDAVGDLVGEPL